MTHPRPALTGRVGGACDGRRKSHKPGRDPAVLGAVAYCAAGDSALAIRRHRTGSLVSPLSSPQSQ
jgi:hypothetical protein